MPFKVSDSTDCMSKNLPPSLVRSFMTLATISNGTSRLLILSNTSPTLTTLPSSSVN